MKVLSCRQPWAELIVARIKDVENRTWSTAHRGDLAIHASLRTEIDACRQFNLQPESLVRGGIVGIVSVRDCIRGSRSNWAEVGQWHWLLERARRVKFFPCRGRLQLFEIPDELLTLL